MGGLGAQGVRKSGWPAEGCSRRMVGEGIRRHRTANWLRSQSRPRCSAAIANRAAVMGRASQVTVRERGSVSGSVLAKMDLNLWVSCAYGPFVAPTTSRCRSRLLPMKRWGSKTPIAKVRSEPLPMRRHPENRRRTSVDSCSTRSAGRRDQRHNAIGRAL